MKLPLELFEFALLRLPDHSIVGFELLAKPHRARHETDYDLGACFCQNLFHNLEHGGRAWIGISRNELMLTTPNGDYVTMTLELRDALALGGLVARDVHENCLCLDNCGQARDRSVRVVLEGAYPKATRTVLLPVAVTA